MKAVAVNDVPDSYYKVGERVEKYAGEARYTGQIVSVYQTTKGGTRYVVEVEPQGFQMICTAGMLCRAPVRDRPAISGPYHHPGDVHPHLRIDMPDRAIASVYCVDEDWHRTTAEAQAMVCALSEKLLSE